jgi:phage terminase small subunit|tara:strand:+ start:642 stop:1139 length:498 start_codon:yes stop_codon:yes gene_type:complete
MPKKIDKEKEIKFIECFVEGDTQGNATQSAIKAGWSKDKSPRQMGAYLKKKYTSEIREKNEERITSTSGMAISVLQDLLKSEQDAVKLNTAKLILELGNFSSQTINLNIDKTAQKSDDELILELNTLMQSIPNFAPKVKAFAEMTEETENTDSEDLKDTEKRVIN